MNLNDNSLPLISDEVLVKLLDLRSFIQHEEIKSDYADSYQFLNAVLDRIFNQLDESIQSTTPTAAWFLESLRIVRIKSSTLKLYAKNACAICTDCFAVNDKALWLPCKHAYHKDCIVEWLNQRNTCPLCQDKLPEENSLEPSLKRRRVRLRRQNLELQSNNSRDDLVRSAGFAQTEISSPVAEWLATRRIIRPRSRRPSS